MHQKGPDDRILDHRDAWPTNRRDWVRYFDDTETRQLQGPTGTLPARRAALSPIGHSHLLGEVRVSPICRPCDHHWSDHDDDGCRWLLCACTLPGERK